MPLFSYKAVNDMGRSVRGTISSVNEVDLESRLKNIGLDLIESRQVKQSGSKANVISTQDLIILCIHMEQLERAGVPILDSIADLRDTAESPKMKNLMTEIYESIRGGNMLSAAFKTQPRVFDKVFVGLIEAGERTGQLADILSHLSDHIKWGAALRGKIKKALIYPIIMMIIMALIITVMMVFVVPKLTGFLLSQGLALPIWTVALIATSDAFVNHPMIIAGVPISIYVAYKLAMLLSERFAYMMEAFKLHMPIIGGTIRKIEMARFCRFFSITFKSGIGILECLDIASGVVNNQIIRESIIAARNGVSEGASLTNSLRISGQFPNLVLRMFKVGEESGNLDGTLETVNFFYDKEVNEAVERLVAVIQPALTVVLGVILAWIIVAVFGPLYGSFSKLNI